MRYWKNGPNNAFTAVVLKTYIWKWSSFIPIMKKVDDIIVTVEQDRHVSSHDIYQTSVTKKFCIIGSLTFGRHTNWPKRISLIVYLSSKFYKNVTKSTRYIQQESAKRNYAPEVQADAKEGNAICLAELKEKCTLCVSSARQSELLGRLLSTAEKIVKSHWKRLTGKSKQGGVVFPRHDTRPQILSATQKMERTRIGRLNVFAV